MDLSDPVVNLGTPLGAELGAIESGLAVFWREASTQSSESAVIRACSSNLIVIVADRQQAGALPPVLADVAEWHPCRSLVAFQESSATDPASPPMQGWILVQCKSQLGGGPQVCSEVITVGANREATEALANTLVSLLVPDLPVFLYWRAPRAADWPLVAGLCRYADLLVVDSDAAFAAHENGTKLLSLLTGTPGLIRIRDLSWQRLTAWRDLIAQFFDVRAARNLLPELSDVEICCYRSAAEIMPGSAFLLVGWLMTRLGWQKISVDERREDSIYNLKAGEAKVTVHMTLTPERSSCAGLKAVKLATRNGKSFTVARGNEQPCLSAVATSSPFSPVVHTVPCPSFSEADLLVQELSLPGEDAAFEAALAAAMALRTQPR